LLHLSHPFVSRSSSEFQLHWWVVSLYCFPYPYFFGFLLMDESQTIRKCFVCCLSILRVSRRIAGFHDGSRTLRVIFCHPHCKLCLNLWAAFVAKVVFDSSLSFLGIFSGNGGKGGRGGNGVTMRASWVYLFLCLDAVIVTLGLRSS
jgi:hypothetical protein